MRTKKTAALLLFITVFLLSSLQVFAEDEISEKYAIHIEFSANNKTKPIEGVGFKAVRIMDINYNVQEGWNDADVQHEKIIDDPMGSALKLKEIEEQKLSDPSVLSGKTDANGKLDFSDIPSGYYLVFQCDQNGAGVGYQMSPPVVIGVPYMEDGEEKNEILVYPKSVPIEKPAQTVNSKNSGAARTGDTADYDRYAALFLISAIVLFIIGSRRRAYYEK